LTSSSSTRSSSCPSRIPCSAPSGRASRQPPHRKVKGCEAIDREKRIGMQNFEDGVDDHRSRKPQQSSESCGLTRGPLPRTEAAGDMRRPASAANFRIHFTVEQNFRFINVIFFMKISTQPGRLDHPKSGANRPHNVSIWEGIQCNRVE
jgi:hypothetical protein